jgi:hypothetical protein
MAIALRRLHLTVLFAALLLVCGVAAAAVAIEAASSVGAGAQVVVTLTGTTSTEDFVTIELERTVEGNSTPHTNTCAPRGRCR